MMSYRNFCGTLITSFLCCFASVGANAQDQENQNAESRIREPVPAATDKTAKKIIQNCLNRLGGIEKLRDIKNRYLECDIREAKNEYKFRYWEAPPHSFKKETIKTKLGRDYIVNEGFDGTTAWEYDLTKKRPFPEELPSKIAERYKREKHFFTPFLDYEQNGLIFEFNGKVKSRGRDNYLLKMFFPNGLTRFHYVDAQTFVVSRRSWQEIIRGTVIEQEEFILKYEKVDGVLMEKKIELAMAGQVFGSMEYTTIELNKDLEPDFFGVPKVKEVWLKSKK